MKNPDARSSIEALLKEMRPLLLVAGVPKHQIRMRSGRHKIDTCTKAFDWLHNVYISDEYKNMVYAWGLLPEEVWKRYIKLEIEGMREQLILEAASKELLKVWKTGRPRLYGKDKVNDSLTGNTSFDSCRP